MRINDESLISTSTNSRSRNEEREYLLRDFREYIDNNNPPILDDLKKKIAPLLSFGYAKLPDLLNIVNSKIYPLQVVDPNKDKVVISVNPAQDLIMEMVENGQEMSNQQFTNKLTLELKGKNLNLVAGKKRYLIKKYRSVGTDGYRSIKALLNSPGEPLSKEKLYLTGTTKPKDIPKLMGIKEDLREWFVVYNSKDKTLTLNKTIYVSNADKLKITNFVNANTGESRE